MTAIVIDQLSKKYHDKTVLSDLNLQVETGEAFGILGGEGAGKTTLMRILMHFMFPDSGKAEILGHNTNTEASAVHEQVAFVAEDPVFYDSLTVAENIRYGTGSLLRGKTHAQRKILLETFALDPKAMGWELSRRERAKLSVVIALLRNPPIFLLDSPFTYLAPVERSNLLKHLHAQKKAGSTLLLASSREEDLLGLCDRIAVLQDGILHKPRSIEAHLENQGVFVIAHGPLSHRDVAHLSYRIVVSTDNEKQFFYRGDLKRLFTFLSTNDIKRVQILDAADADLYAQHFGGDA